LPERWAIIVETRDGDSRPSAIPVRLFLKRLARSAGLRCVDIRTEPTSPPPPAKPGGKLPPGSTASAREGRR
jgi:hypothetical protein